MAKARGGFRSLSCEVRVFHTHRVLSCRGDGEAAGLPEVEGEQRDNS